ncbi:MAG TPA: hypothetical protein VFY71_11670 [Planctomycetota bacterium]|nr:hypothetical protein [Planctomycetota bacterium]
MWLSTADTRETIVQPEMVPAKTPRPSIIAVHAAPPGMPAPDVPAPPLRDGSPRPMDVPALPRIAGLVERTADGSTLDNVRVIPVLAVPADGSARLTAVEARQGRFEFGPEVVAQGVGALFCVWTEMHPHKSFDFTVSAPTGRQLTQTVGLTEVDGPLDGLRITLDTGWVVRGHVRDAAGQPVRARLGTDHDERIFWCDAEGSFVVRDLAWDDPDLALTASARGYSTTRCLVPVPERPACVQSIDLTLIREP